MKFQQKAEKLCEFRTPEMQNDLDIFTEVTEVIQHIANIY